jgi:predicted nucleotidyltransferase
MDSQAPQPAVTPRDREAIWFVLRRNFGPDVEVWVFGSRAEGRDDGNYNLYVEHDDGLEHSLLARGQSIEELQVLLWGKVDLSARGRNEPKTVFEQVAKRNAVPLPVDDPISDAPSSASLRSPSMNAEDRRLLLADALQSLRRAVFRLEESLSACAPLFPADDAAYESLDEIALIQLDALGVRYARCQELLGQTLRSASAFLGAPSAPFQVMLDGLRQEGLTLPVRAWEETRALRNANGHVYLMSSQDFVGHFTEIARQGPSLIAAVAALTAFAEGLSPAA